MAQPAKEQAKESYGRVDEKRRGKLIANVLGRKETRAESNFRKQTQGMNEVRKNRLRKAKQTVRAQGTT